MLVLLAAAGPARAQSGFIQPLNPDADALASQMRRLAANPRDLGALIRAGELAVTLGDPTAAAGLFARAEQIDPRNPRIKAGMGTLLVLAERPGEALRRFAEAEALGLGPQAYAAHRGLAYDLIGQQERAQRDYRLALRGGGNDETIRRYALSLGISGKRDEALALLDPMLRRSDRAAWRTRAFILAMSGDMAGASRIATSMMPGGLAQGLQPFFERLAALPAADRAFAVHFGEIRATPARLADARLTPPLASFFAEPGRVTQVAAAAAAPASRSDRRSRQTRRRGRETAKLAAAAPAPLAPPLPLPRPPGYVGGAALPSVTLASNRPLATYPPFGTAPLAGAARARIAKNAAAAPVIVPGRTPIASAPLTPSSAPAVAPASVQAVVTPAPAPTPTPKPTPTPVPVVVPVPTPNVGADKVPVAEARVGGGMTAASAPLGEASAVPASPTVATPVVAGSPATVPGAVVAAAPPVAAAVPARPALSEDSILARIVSNIAVPGSELDVAPVAPVAVTPAPVAQRAAAVAEPETAQIDAAEVKAAAAKKAAEAKALAAKKAAAEKKLLAAKKAVAAEKAAADKKKAELAKQDEARVWVQVAGGANGRDLLKEWARVAAKAPAAFKGKQGWSTPLRATNRVLAGPFKTESEARAFVNAIAKAGVSGFTFTSAAGQKIVKLPPK